MTRSKRQPRGEFIYDGLYLLIIDIWIDLVHATSLHAVVQGTKGKCHTVRHTVNLHEDTVDPPMSRNDTTLSTLMCFLGSPAANFVLPTFSQVRVIFHFIYPLKRNGTIYSGPR